MKAHVRASSMLDLAWVASRMRKEDLAGTDMTPWTFTARMARLGGECKTLVNEAGEPIAIAGLFPLKPGTQFMWLIACVDDLTPYRFHMLRTGKRWLAKYGRQVVITQCVPTWVAANNFLRHLGFEKTGEANGLSTYRKQ